MMKAVYLLSGPVFGAFVLCLCLGAAKCVLWIRSNQLRHKNRWNKIIALGITKLSRKFFHCSPKRSPELWYSCPKQVTTACAPHQMYYNKCSPYH